MRQGLRSGTQTVVVYLALTGDAPSMAGFAVSRTVGGAVIRNRVTRRLRAIMRELLPTLPEGSKVVIRALPAAAEATFDHLRADVDNAVRRSLKKAVAA